MTLENVPTITTVLSIGGHEFNPDELTSLVGVEPTKIWTQKRDWIRVTHPDINTVEWVYEVENQKKWSLGEAIEYVLDVFWSKREEICQFLSKNQLRMHVDCRPFGDATVLEYIIGPEAIRKMAFFGATLSLAVYKDEL